MSHRGVNLHRIETKRTITSSDHHIAFWQSRACGNAKGCAHTNATQRAGVEVSGRWQTHACKAQEVTPIGHHGNLLILTPGRYTFGDFLRVGAPLTLAIAFTPAWLAA